MWITNLLQVKNTLTYGWHAVLKDEGVEVFILAGGAEGSNAALADWKMSEAFTAYGVSEVYNHAHYIIPDDEFEYVMGQCDEVVR